MTTYLEKECSKHGITKHRRENKNRWRCIRCSTEYRMTTRTRNKERIVKVHGGKCQICGYDKYLGALDFHHVDPSTKDFHISKSPTNFSYARLAAEAEKCILLCSNCHREVEGGITQCGTLCIGTEVSL